MKKIEDFFNFSYFMSVRDKMPNDKTCKELYAMVWQVYFNLTKLRRLPDYLPKLKYAMDIPETNFVYTYLLHSYYTLLCEENIYIFRKECFQRRGISKGFKAPSDQIYRRQLHEVINFLDKLYEGELPSTYSALVKGKVI